MTPLANEDASMFGKEGIDEVIRFKRGWLTQSLNYNVDAVHEIDVANRVIVVGFDCLLPGNEGRGVDVIQLDESGKVCGVAALRHMSVGKM